MNYINKDLLQFYPTPKHQAYKMALKVPKFAHTIIDPQGGEGALLDAVKKRFDDDYSYRRMKYYSCEIDENRQHILVGKGYNVITDDFLKLDNPHLSFDCIIMNPPFNCGIKHFLKAWEMLENKGVIICLLNKTSINSSTKEGELFKKILKDSDAELEYQESVFSNSFRKTNVETVLITAKKQNKESKFNFLNDQWSKELEEEKASLITPQLNTENGLVKYDFIDTIVAQYNITKKAYASVFESHRKINFYSPVSFKSDTIKAPAPYHEFEQELRSGCWQEIFSQTKLVNYMSAGMIQEFKNLEKQQQNRVFNKKNIIRVLDAIMANFKKVRLSVIEEAFDNCTKYHKENRSHKEGWKTNDSYKINKKIILPNFWASWSMHCHVSTSSSTKIGDLEKALCLLLGMNYFDIQKQWQIKLGLKKNV